MSLKNAKSKTVKESKALTIAEQQKEFSEKVVAQGVSIMNKAIKELALLNCSLSVSNQLKGNLIESTIFVRLNQS